MISVIYSNVFIYLSDPYGFKQLFESQSKIVPRSLSMRRNFAFAPYTQWTHRNIVLTGILTFFSFPPVAIWPMIFRKPDTCSQHNWQVFEFKTIRFSHFASRDIPFVQLYLRCKPFYWSSREGIENTSWITRDLETLNTLHFSSISSMKKKSSLAGCNQPP